MQLELVVKFLLMLVVANGAPVLAKKLLGGLLAYPLDAGRTLPDGQPLFGPSKTVRGILVGVLASALVAPLVGFAWTTGLVIGAAAMTGDLFSSFLKRRLGRPPSSRAFGLDQIPESLLPALASVKDLGLTLADVAAIVVLFTLGGQALSLILFKLRLRDHPY
jgi:CDP-2,3-bis-(O-geranylgeranyl)-sn-glycerol synthase